MGCGRRPERRVADRLARALGHGGTVRALAAVTTGLVDEARRRHDTAPTATAALGRALTGALLLAGTIKRDERLSLEFSGDGPLRGVLVDATPDGDARGFVLRPATHLPPRAGKLDVGGALGRGVLCVMRVPITAGTLYRSIVPLESGEIGADLAGYLLNSEQAPAAVGVGVFVDVDGRVVAAGGYLVQALPGASQGVLETIAERIERLAPPSELVREGLGASDILRRIVGDDVSLLKEREVRFRCRCSRERVAVAILAMGRGEIESVLAGDRRAEVTCEFCTERYVLEEGELEGLLGAGTA
jgi:molecular chaperone Hsp33